MTLPAELPPVGLETETSAPPPQESRSPRLEITAAHFGMAGLVLIALLALMFIAPPRLLSIEALQERRHELQALVRDRPMLSLVLYMGLYSLVTGLSLPGALVMTLAGGFLFGMWEGAAAAVTGAGAGATAMFLAARSAWGEALRKRALATGGLAARLEAGARRNAFAYILTLRLIPGVPIWLVNVAAGLLRMSTPAFIVTTVLGFAPSTLVYAAIGSGLGNLFERGQKPTAAMLLQPQWMAMMSGLAALALLPIAWRWWSERRR